MALFNEILVGRFNRALQKATGIKGQAPAPQLAAEITPGLALFSGIEDRFLLGWGKFGIANAVGPTAAQFASIQLRNPTGSNVAIVIEKLALWGDTLGDFGNISRAQTGADLGTVVGIGNNQRMDPRSGLPTLILSNQTQGAATDLAGIQGVFSWNAAKLLIELVFHEDQEIPLMPGDAVRMVAQTANTKLVLGAIWRERFLEESERT